MNKVLLRVKRELLEHIPHIKKTAYLQRVEVEDLPHSEFALTAHWKDGSYRQVFTRTDVLGPFANAPPLSQRPCMRTCKFRDGFIRNVLNARGL